MAIKVDSNRLFNVYFGDKKNVVITQIEAKNASEAIAKANSKVLNTKLENQCTAVESNNIYNASIGIECMCHNKDDDGVFEIIVRGTNSDEVERMRNAIALAIGGKCLGNYTDDGGRSDDGRFLQKVIIENGMSVVRI